MKKLNLLSLFLLLTASVVAQVNLDYQKPPQEILDLVDVPRAPWVLMNTEGDTMLLMYRDSYKTIAELSEEELRLGGLRINPKTNIGSRTTFYNDIKIKGIEETEAGTISGLPEDAKLSNFNWSPDESKMAFTNTIEDGVQVWVLDLETAIAKRVTEAFVNANMGNPISWFKDGESLLVNMLPATRKELVNTAEAVPTGPTISTSDGSKAQNRTYQDLLQNPNDVFNFEQLATSALVKVNLDGTSTLWKDAAMYSDVSFSPDGNYIMTSTIHKPFSYIVPYYRFPETVTVYQQDGTEVKVVNETPLLEELPQGFMATQTGKRRISWRADQPATLYWVEALDQGDPEVEVEYRDQVFMQKAPFSAAPQKVIKTINRYSGILWGDANTAIAYDRWWNTRNTKTYVFNPSDGSNMGEVISDRSYQDVYSDPGNFVTHDNEYGRSVLTLVNGNAYLIGDGFSDKGQFPFIDKMNLKTQETERIYESEYTDKLESLQKALDIEAGKILVRIEAPTEYPNYYIRDLNDNSLDQ
ncbi:MAG: S9 family peptidase, partial [Bacteroidota bacterium]|nr:S9 family peptidase [Bacteroidota bacterium]